MREEGLWDKLLFVRVKLERQREQDWEEGLTSTLHKWEEYI